MTGTVPAEILPDVSRETEAALNGFADLVRKWSPSINLVSRASLTELWPRHILDSVQIFAHAPKNPGLWADLGSGGGFPGIVAAILAKGEGATTRFVLVESDQRKSAFLRTAARELGLPVTVLSERIEAIAPLDADILSARALAPLSDLLGFAVRHLKPGGVAIFPKGRTALAEIAAARGDWRFDLAATASKTDPDAQILTLTGISRA